MPNTNNFNWIHDGSKQGDIYRDHESHIGLVDITGVTAATEGQTTAFPHGLNLTPSGAHVIVGNAYVTSVDATNVNVASVAVSQNFRVRVVK